MKQKIIGTYYLGQDQVQLVVREGTGGEFFSFPEVGSIPRFKIGIEHESFEEVLEVLLHETIEFAMTRYQCRMKNTGLRTTEHSQYVFIMTHTQFSEVMARSAEFLHAAIGDIKKAWKKWNKKETK